MINKVRRKVLSILLIAILTLSACGGDGLDGTWVPTDSTQEGAYDSITFDGDSISIPGVTMPAMEAMGVKYVYKISDGNLTISTSGGGFSFDAVSLSYSKDGDSLTLNGVEYNKQ